MKKSKFLQLVKEELDNIKLNATQDEIDSLDFGAFSSEYSQYCIYGQMTGLCDSDRARELTPKGYLTRNYELGGSFTAQGIVRGSLFTPMEIYLVMVSEEHSDRTEKHREIIDYLKGRQDSIKL